MKTYRVVFLVLAVTVSVSFAQEKRYDTNSVIITRVLTKDLFELNNVPYMEPLVTSINATSNSRFFNQAFVPKKVSKPYFRFGVHGMTGFVRDDQLLYTPQLPTEKKPVDVGKYVSFHIGAGGSFVVDRLDTVGLATSIVKRLLQIGLDSGKVSMPSQAATIFGSKKDTVTLNREFLANQLKTNPEFAVLFNLLPKSTQDLLTSAVLKMPDQLQIPPGQNIRRIYAMVPQLEIGSLYGTEMMVRYIPPIELDTSIGEFSFYGIAFKHSISQYFEDPKFDCAIQIGYQGTSLTNVVGVTESKLESHANFFNANIHASKRFDKICDLYTGFNYERVVINSSFSYILSRQVQITLGLLESKDGSVPDPANGYPGDNVVQTSSAEYINDNYKWTIGAAKQIGPIAIFLDYSVSKFNILSGGLEYRF